MARIIALDWDNRELHLVAANVSRGKVHVERAASWRDATPFQAVNAAEFGERLRQRLKEAGIAPAPVIVCLGRDRVVVKEVRYPQVASDVEAAVVRNQILKELTESPDDVLMDYFPLKEPGRNGERRAISLVVRKDLVNGIHNVCRAAGLKPLALTARPFGIAACVKKLAGHAADVPAPPAADAVVGVLTVTHSWAEFAVVRGEQLLFARPVGVGDALFGEVRRNLAAYAGQPHLNFPRDAMQALYVAGDGENALLREKLRETLGIPVHGLDPLAGEERVQVAGDNRAGFTAAIGLLQLWASQGAMPVNFVKPRESRKAASPGKRRFAVYGVLAVAAVALLAVVGWTMLDRKQQDLARARADKAKAEKLLKDLQPEIKYQEALGDFNEAAIPWLDELYDLAARTPLTKGFRITHVNVSLLPQKTAKEKEKAKERGKDKEKVYTARMTIEGQVPRDQYDLITQLKNKINKDPYCSASLEIVKNPNPTDQKRGLTEQFMIRVDIAHRSPMAYIEQIDPKQLPQRPPARLIPDDDPDIAEPDQD